MKVLMLGWEFPPYFAGGVGVVCEAMTKALARRGAEITYLMPRAPARDDEPGVRIRSLTTPGRPIEVVTLPSVLVSYATTPGARTISVPGEPRVVSATLDRLSEQQWRATAALVLEEFGRHPRDEWDRVQADVQAHFGYPVTRQGVGEVQLDEGQMQRLGIPGYWAGFL